MSWEDILGKALEVGVKEALERGHKPPGSDELERIIQSLQRKAEEVLALAIVGVAVGAIGVAAKASVDIASLGESPQCPNCKGVLTQHISKPVVGDAIVTYSCDFCKWVSP